MKFLKFAAMAIAAFALFTTIAAVVPGIGGRLVALLVITAVVSPFFLHGSEDEPNPNGGIGALAILFAVACLSLTVGGA